jgi:hypothetical protein
MIDELELLRHYMDSAPRPASVDLEEARLRLNSEMELETTTTAPTKAATRIPGVSNLRFRFKRPVVALLTQSIERQSCVPLRAPYSKNCEPRSCRQRVNRPRQQIQMLRLCSYGTIDPRDPWWLSLHWLRLR